MFLFVGLYLDSEAAMDFLISRPDINKDKIVVFGRSLGGAVAAWLASSKKYSPHIAALVLENTFTSLPDIAKSIFADLFILEYIPVFLFKNKVRRHQWYIFTWYKNNVDNVKRSLWTSQTFVYRPGYM